MFIFLMHSADTPSNDATWGKTSGKDEKQERSGRAEWGAKAFPRDVFKQAR